MTSETDLARENAVLKAYVAELEERMKLLEQLADSDTLTPLPNRRFFFRAIERAVAQLTRHGTPSALLFVDMDNLKAINDGRGHAAGDEALVQVAMTLREKIRSGDVVARIGGDEFGVLLEYLEPDAAIEKARLLGLAITELSMGFSVSIGVTALLPEDTPDSALTRADARMYEAKRRRG
jgi:diguanylate cyclase (GGDEF)-like protein